MYHIPCLLACLLEFLQASTQATWGSRRWGKQWLRVIWARNRIIWARNRVTCCFCCCFCYCFVSACTLGMWSDICKVRDWVWRLRCLVVCERDGVIFWGGTRLFTLRMFPFFLLTDHFCKLTCLHSIISMSFTALATMKTLVATAPLVQIRDCVWTISKKKQRLSR